MGRYGFYALVFSMAVMVSPMESQQRGPVRRFVQRCVDGM